MSSLQLINKSSTSKYIHVGFGCNFFTLKDTLCMWVFLKNIKDIAYMVVFIMKPDFRK